MSISGLTDEIVLQMRRECREDITKDTKYFSTKFGISRHTINKAIRGETFKRLNHIEPPFVRESCSISDDVVLECRRRVRENPEIKNRDLALEFDVAMSTLEHAIRGDHYSHLNEIEPPVLRVVSKDEKRVEARRLYQEGKSYRDLQKLLGVSKSSLSGWLRDIVRPPKGANSNIAQFSASSPYEGFTVFVSEGKNGAVRYRLENSLTKERYLLTRARYNMSVHLKRRLTDDEVVSRCKGTSDDITNLEVLSKAAYNLKRKVNRDVVCTECGVSFTKKHSSTKTCSKACSISLRAKNSVVKLGNKVRTCKVCGTGFTSLVPHAKYCSSKCHDTQANSQRKLKRTENKPKKHTLECVMCEKPFTSFDVNAEVCHRKKCNDFIKDREEYESELG